MMDITTKNLAFSFPRYSFTKSIHVKDKAYKRDPIGIVKPKNKSICFETVKLAAICINKYPVISTKDVLYLTRVDLIIYLPINFIS